MNANSNKDMKEVTVGSDEVQGGLSKYKVDNIVVKDEGLIDYAYDLDSDDNYWYKFGITNEEDIAFHKGMEPMYSRGAGRMLRAKKAGFKSFEFAKSEINNFKDEFALSDTELKGCLDYLQENESISNYNEFKVSLVLLDQIM